MAGKGRSVLRGLSVYGVLFFAVGILDLFFVWNPPQTTEGNLLLLAANVIALAAFYPFLHHLRRRRMARAASMAERFRVRGFGGEPVPDEWWRYIPKGRPPGWLSLSVFIFGIIGLYLMDSGFNGGDWVRFFVGLLVAMLAVPLFLVWQWTRWKGRMRIRAKTG